MAITRYTRKSKSSKQKRDMTRIHEHVACTRDRPVEELELLDQVLIGFLLFSVIALSTAFCNDKSMNGPFLSDLGMNIISS